MPPYEIAFGTSGWRDRMDGMFNKENVLRAAFGIGKYLQNTRASGPILVGYDARKNSDIFAADVAGVLAGMGFEVLLSNAPAPTPAAVYGVIANKAAGGVQVTASHNPPEYNGIKFMLSTGATPTKDATNLLGVFIPKGPVEPKKFSGKTISLRQGYMDALRKVLDLSEVKGMRIVVDTRHGAGAGYLADLLSGYGAVVTEINRDPAPDFGGMSPNPTEPNVKDLVAAVKEQNAALGISNDGDADRFAVVDQAGRYYGANETGLMLCDYLFKYKGRRGRIAKSIQSTAAFDRLGKKFGVEVAEVPVGFKNIAKELLAGAVFGVEGAALGVAFGNWIPDKDGIAAGAMVCEMVSREGAPLDQIWKRVSTEYAYGNFVMVEIPRMEKVLDGFYFLMNDKGRDMFGGREIIGRSYIDGIKLSLDDGSWVLVRESGTEPLVRAYIEGRNKKEVDELTDAVKRFFGM